MVKKVYNYIYTSELGHSNEIHSFWSRIIQKSHAGGRGGGIYKFFI